MQSGMYRIEWIVDVLYIILIYVYVYTSILHINNTCDEVWSIEKWPLGKDLVKLDFFFKLF